MSTRHPIYTLTIDDHGLAGDGQTGRFGTCSACKRTNKVIGQSGTCVMPRMTEALPENDRPVNGCVAQRGHRPERKRY